MYFLSCESLSWTRRRRKITTFVFEKWFAPPSLFYFSLALFFLEQRNFVVNVKLIKKEDRRFEKVMHEEES